MKVSVVIPTYGRPGVSRDVLDMLVKQERKPDEVIIVDQNTEELRKDGWPRDLSIRVIRSRPEGPAKARNLGAKVAQHELLLFLDDDVEFGPELITAHVDTFSRFPRAGVVAGAVWKSGEEGKSVPTWSVIEDPIWQLFLRPHTCYEMMALGVSTGNLSVRASVFAKLGGFDETYGPYRGEEHDFAIRAWRAGVFLIYQPRASVIHRDPALGGRRRLKKEHRGSWKVVPVPEPSIWYLYGKHFPGI